MRILVVDANPDDSERVELRRDLGPVFPRSCQGLSEVHRAAGFARRLWMPEFGSCRSTDLDIRWTSGRDVLSRSRRDTPPVRRNVHEASATKRRGRADEGSLDDYVVQVAPPASATAHSLGTHGRDGVHPCGAVRIREARSDARPGRIPGRFVTLEPPPSAFNTICPRMLSACWHAKPHVWQ